MDANKVNYLDIMPSLSEFERIHAPKELNYLGSINLLTEGRRVSVVGSRNASENGILRARIITEALVQSGFIVVSGLARGIDTVAHETAISMGGKTIAVLGTPLDQVYPKENDNLLSMIKKDHLAISQFPVGYPIQRQNFMIRNRTMALISDATIIVEATEASGTRHQGWEALRLGRQLFILQNVAEDTKLSWPREMIGYGAIVLTRENLEEVLQDVPYSTARLEFSF